MMNGIGGSRTSERIDPDRRRKAYELGQSAKSGHQQYIQNLVLGSQAASKAKMLLLCRSRNSGWIQHRKDLCHKSRP
jgi:hypothetical protein